MTVFLSLRMGHTLFQAHSHDHSGYARPRSAVLSIRAEAAQATTGPAIVARQQLQLVISSKCIPHPEKAHYGGEDAHFISSVGGGVLGVADGVGGWNESGISPAEYSRTFMETARKFLEGELDLAEPSTAASADASSDEWMDSRKAWDGIVSDDESNANGASAAANGSTSSSSSNSSSNGNGNGAGSSNGSEAQQEVDAEAEQQRQREREQQLLLRTPLQALDIAHRRTRLPGSATACILRLDGGRGVLNAANVGDSGFLLVRDGKLMFQSPALQHFFDCPYQFGAYPEYAEATDSAEDAAVYDFEMLPGDVVILATDGLLDNCYTDELVQLAPTSAAKVAEAAAAMAELASRHARDPEFESPYTEEAMQEGFDIPFWEKVMNAKIKDGKLKWGKLRGGKLDDITVIVAYVQRFAEES